jgi:cytochrome P450
MKPYPEANITAISSLAYGEMRLILTHLLWHFDLELMDDSKDWTDQKIWTLWNKGAMHVKLTPVH